MSNPTHITPEAQALREATGLLHEASHEIKRLRVAVAELSPDALAYRTLQTIIDMIPRERRGESVNVTWMIDKFLDGQRAAHAPLRDDDIPA